MGDLSAHFSRREFRCKCGRCDRDTVDAALLAILEQIRAHYGVPVTINSGHRCSDHNRVVGGAPDSQHLYGRAADIVVKGVGPAAVYAMLDPIHPGGLGKYKTFTHVDTRTKGAPSRWSG